MKRYLFITFIAFFISATAYSEEINTAKNDPGNNDAVEVPIDVDINYDNIKIKFNKEWAGKVIVSDSEKVVYNDQISAPRHATLDINLRGSEGGDYDILLIDNAGNVTDSSFYLTGTDNH